MTETIQLKKVLFEDKAVINSKIGNSLTRISNKKLREAAGHLLMAGGKRIRPALLLTAYKAVGGTEVDKAASVAAAIELIHNWTLIHDDIIDKSETRRNVPTVHVKWDHTVAILAGDILNNLAFELISDSGFDEEKTNTVIKEVTRASMQVIDGEMMDVDFENSDDITEDDYFEMIGKKTGALLSTSAKAGAIIGGGQIESVEAIEKYGEKIGIAFQIQDDLLDVLADHEKFGKEIGKDIKEGKKTLMVLHALHHLNHADAQEFADILSSNSTNETDVERALELMTSAGSILYAQDMLTSLIDEANRELQVLPETQYRMALEELSHYIINRIK